MLLALDTSTYTSSLALYAERGVIGETTWTSHENHTRSLMPELVRMLALVGTSPADVQAVGVATGPGSFTGLRIGLSAAKGLAFSLQVPIVGVPTLEVTAGILAAQPAAVCAVIHAGRARYGAGLYHTIEGQMRRRGDYVFGSAAEVAAHVSALDAGAQCILIGEVEDALRAEFRDAFGDGLTIANDALNVRRAGVLAAMAWARWRAGELDDLNTLAPYYIPTASLSEMNESDTLPVAVEPMSVADLADVINIERISFPSPWSARAYEYELRYNEMAHYFVARLREGGRNGGHAEPMAWLKRLFRPAPQLETTVLVGYVGYWLMAGEAHISTIAVHPNYRGRAIGELLLSRALADASERGSHVATLEVRVSNTNAQQLYLKYGFEKVGLRKAYYSDNNEDAFIMTTPPLGSGQYRMKLVRLKGALEMRLREAGGAPLVRSAG